MVNAPAAPPHQLMTIGLVHTQKSGPKTTNPLQRALDALQQEAARRGADGVVSVQVSHSHYKVFGSWVIEDVIVTGTAVKVVASASYPAVSPTQIRM